MNMYVIVISRALEKWRKDTLILLEPDLQSRSLSQLSSVNRTYDRLVTEGCGQIMLAIVLVAVTTIVADFRNQHELC